MAEVSMEKKQDNLSVKVGDRILGNIAGSKKDLFLQHVFWNSAP